MSTSQSQFSGGNINGFDSPNFSGRYLVLCISLHQYISSENSSSYVQNITYNVNFVQIENKREMCDDENNIRYYQLNVTVSILAKVSQMINIIIVR